MDKPADGKKVSVAEAYKMMHQLNKGITVRGLNALEIEVLKKTSAEDWKNIHAEYKKWTNQIWVIKSSIIWIFLMCGLIVFFLFPQVKYLGIAAVVLACYSLSKRSGHQEGYVDGYSEGVGTGVNKALGIDEKLSDELYDIAKDMKINGPIVANIEERELEAAVSEFNALIQANSEDLASYSRRADLFLKHKKYDEAIQDCNFIIGKNSPDPVVFGLAYYTRASAYTMKGDLPHGIADYSQVIKLEPNDAFNYASRARTYKMMGNLDEAIADLKMAISLNPNEIEFYQDRAVAFFDKKNYAECWQDVQRVEKMGGHPPQFMMELKKHLGLK